MLQNTDKGGKEMRRDVVGIGAILIIFGVFLYFIGNNMVMNAPYNILSGGYSGYQSDLETGRSLVGIGVILTLIGAISAVAGFVAKNNKDAIPLKNERFCPTCGRHIPFDAIACPYCKKNFKAHLKGDEVKTEEKEEIQEDNSYICSKCGYENTAKGKFCLECGTKL